MVVTPISYGVVSVTGNSATSVSYAALVGGKPFGTKVPASGEQWDLNVAPDVKPKNPKDYKVVGTSVPRFDLPEKFTGRVHHMRRTSACQECFTAAWCARRS